MPSSEEALQYSNSFYENKAKMELLDKDEVQKRAHLTAWANADYEQRLWVNGNRHHPDFLIIHPVTGKVYIWEHNGMMDIPRYIRKASSCLEDYSVEGFLLDDDLIFTNESNSFPLTTEQVEAKIRSILFDDGRRRNNNAKCLKHCMPKESEEPQKE